MPIAPGPLPSPGSDPVSPASRPGNAPLSRYVVWPSLLLIPVLFPLLTALPRPVRAAPLISSAIRFSQAKTLLPELSQKTREEVRAFFSRRMRFRHAAQDPGDSAERLLKQPRGNDFDAILTRSSVSGPRSACWTAAVSLPNPIPAKRALSALDGKLYSNQGQGSEEAGP